MSNIVMTSEARRDWTERIQWALALCALGLLIPVGGQGQEFSGPVSERAVDDLQSAWESTLQRSEPHWVGWRIDSVLSDRGGRCWLRLGEGHQRWTDEPDPSRGRREAVVFFELVGGEIREVELSDTGCRIDTTGVEVELWSGVSAEQSFRWIDRELLSDDDPEMREYGAAAIAAHAVSGVETRLEDLARGDADDEVRHQAIFWLGEQRGRAGFESLRRLEDELPNEDIEEALVFAYHVSDEPGATERLFELARHHRDSEVREQALFWVAQEAGERATETLERAIDEDPESEVRENAVFGLSQLPPDQGIPALLRVARTHRDPEVREAAFFWLGQSGDPRAMALFAEVLEVD